MNYWLAEVKPKGSFVKRDSSQTYPYFRSSLRFNPQFFPCQLENSDTIDMVVRLLHLEQAKTQPSTNIGDEACLQGLSAGS